MIDGKLVGNIYPFWAKLTELERVEILQNTNSRHFLSGDMVHEGGSECTGVLGVVRGRLRAFMLSEEGKEVTLFRLVEGDCCMLSASCMIKNISFDVHVSAEVDTDLVVISPGVYDKLAKSNAAVSSFVSEIVSMRFSEVMWVVEQLLFMKMDRRVSIFLMEQAALEESDTITLTHEQIAGHLGTAREVISRTLKYLSGEGYVSVSRKGVTILDRRGLAKI